MKTLWFLLAFPSLVSACPLLEHAELKEMSKEQIIAQVCSDSEKAFQAVMKGDNAQFKACAASLDKGRRFLVLKHSFEEQSLRNEELATLCKKQK